MSTVGVASALVVIALLTAGSVAVRAVSRIWLRHWVERRLAGAALAEHFLDRPQRLVVAAGTTIALTAFVGGAATAGRLSSAVPAWVLPVRVIGVAVAALLLAQVLPRAVARRWPTRVAPAMLPLLRVADALVTPARLLGARLAAGAHARADAARTPEHATRTEIEELLREGQLEGVSETQELEIISGVVQFGEKRARDVLTPRDQVFALDVGTPPADLAAAVARAGYSRVPVYRGSLDDVVGIVHAFDVLKTGGETMPPVLGFYTAAPDARCTDLLQAMLRARRHLAVVRDAGGHTIGVLTLEDLLEELVGEIRDEHDEPEPPGAPAGPGPARGVLPDVRG